MLEGAIQSIDEVDEIVSTSRVGSTVIAATLDKSLVEFEQVWDDLRNEVRAVEDDLPDGAHAPTVNSNFGDVSSLCLAMYQIPAPGGDEIEHVYSDRDLEVYAELVEQDLEALPAVSAVTLYGLQDERLYVEVDSSDWAKIGTDTEQLRAALNDRNIVVSSGQLETSEGRFVLRATGELNSVRRTTRRRRGTGRGGAAGPTRRHALPSTPDCRRPAEGASPLPRRRGARGTLRHARHRDEGRLERRGDGRTGGIASRQAS